MAKKMLLLGGPMGREEEEWWQTGINVSPWTITTTVYVVRWQLTHKLSFVRAVVLVPEEDGIAAALHCVCRGE